MTCTYVRTIRFCLPLLLPAALAACSTPGDFPSLEVRESEMSMRARPAPSQSEAPPELPAADASLETRIDGLLDLARKANANFEARRPSAVRTIAAAGAKTSDSWSAAQIALAQLETSRSASMTALADLDELYFAARDESPNDVSPKARTISAAREQVSGWIAAQDSVLKGLSAQLSR